MVRPKAKQVIRFPKPYDVYLGRGKGSFNTLGNRRYLEKTRPFQPRYRKACVGQKADIVREVMHAIKRCKDQAVVRFLKKLGKEELAHPQWRAAVEDANLQSDDETILTGDDCHLYREATESEVFIFIQYRLRDRNHLRRTDCLKTSVTRAWPSEDNSPCACTLNSVHLRPRGIASAENVIKLGDQLDLLDLPLSVISQKQVNRDGALDQAVHENRAPPLHDVEEDTELEARLMDDFDLVDDSLPLPELDPPLPLPPLPCMLLPAEKIKPIKKRNVRRSDDQNVRLWLNGGPEKPKAYHRQNGPSPVKFELLPWHDEWIDSINKESLRIFLNRCDSDGKTILKRSPSFNDDVQSFVQGLIEL
jgi:hypothetical protein